MLYLVPFSSECLDLSDVVALHLAVAAVAGEGEADVVALHFAVAAVQYPAVHFCICSDLLVSYRSLVMFCY